MKTFVGNNGDMVFRTPNWLLIAAFIGLISVTALGAYLYNRMAADYREDIAKELQAALDYKREQLLLWREQQYANASLVQYNQMLIQALDSWLGNRQDNTLRQAIINQLDDLHNSHQYRDIMLTDALGNIILAAHGAVDVLSREARTNVIKAVGTGQILLSDFYLCSLHGEPHLDLVAPIITKGGRKLGAVVIRILPEVYLYPLMKRNAFQYRTFETLLVRQEGDSVLFLNDIRFYPNAALRLKIPLERKEVPAVKAILEGRSVTEGVDYRGHKVLAVTGRVPDTNWGLVAKVDLEEIGRPLREKGLIIGLTLLMALLLICGSAVLIMANQRKEHYKKLYRLEAERQALEKHYQYLTKYANDIIFLLDEDRRIVEINERGLEAYGYSRGELLGKDASIIRAPEQGGEFKALMEKLKKEGALLYEARHRRKDGTIFPVEISSRTIEIEGKKYLQGIARDITERKEHELTIQERNEELEAANQELMAAEEELRHTNEKLENNCAELESANEELKAAEEELKSQVDELISLRNQLQKEKTRAEVLIDSAPNIVVGLGERSKILLFNRYAEKLTGYRREEVLGQNWIDLFIPSEMKEQMYRVWDEIVANRYIEHFYENPITCKNGDERLIGWSNTVLSENGKFDMVFSLGVDVTEQRQAERHLAEASAQWSATFNAMSDGIAILDNDQTILQANQAFLGQLGMKAEEVTGRKCYELVHPEKRPHWDCPFAKMMKSCRREEMDLEMGGKIYNVVLEPIFDKQGEMTGAVHLVSDITGRKSDEKKIRDQLFELQRWQKVMLDREDRVSELKQEVNDLLAKLGRPMKYGQQA